MIPRIEWSLRESIDLGVLQAQFVVGSLKFFKPQNFWTISHKTDTGVPQKNSSRARRYFLNEVAYYVKLG